MGDLRGPFAHPPPAGRVTNQTPAGARDKNKLITYSLDGSVLRWVRAFLTNRTQRVAVENSYSDEIAVTSGVPQGSVLGPLLFLLYINDLPDNIKCNIRMYADDVVFYVKLFSNEYLNSTQQVDLYELSRWCRK